MGVSQNTSRKDSLFGASKGLAASPHAFLQELPFYHVIDLLIFTLRANVNDEQCRLKTKLFELMTYFSLLFIYVKSLQFYASAPLFCFAFFICSSNIQVFDANSLLPLCGYYLQQFCREFRKGTCL